MTVLEANRDSGPASPAPRDRLQTIARLKRIIAGAGVLLAVSGIVTMILIGRGDYFTDDLYLQVATWAIGFGALAWLAIPRQPRNRVVTVTALAALVSGLGAAAWVILILSGQVAGLDMSPSADGIYGLSPIQVPTVTAVLYMLILPTILGGDFLILTLGLLWFPDGHPPSRRWRWLGWTAIGLIVTIPMAMAWDWRPGSTVPYAFTDAEFVGIGRVVYVGFPLLFLVVVLCVASLVVGYRQSEGMTRQQYRWIGLGSMCFAISLLPVMITLVATGGVPDTNDWRNYLLTAGSLVLITCYGIAVTRFRLYEIDLVINRTILFALLAAFITLVYALIVVGFGRMVGGSEGLWLPVVATAIVAVSFEPVRGRAQRWANRLVYGRRATPYEVLSNLTERLAVSETGEGILTRMAGLMRDGTGAERATVWLGPPGAMDPAGTWPPDVDPGPEPSLDTEGVYAVRHAAQIVGALQVTKPRGTVLSTQEVRLISDMAGSTGLILGYQRLNDELGRRAKEVVASRKRLVGAQDEERKRLERELQEGAQTLIADLAEGVAAVCDLARQHGARDLADSLHDMAEEARVALDEVRSLAKGIYPSVLAKEGLRAALDAMASASPVEVTVSADNVGRHAPELETAVYFDISEAFTNAVKHAKPLITVELEREADVLRFTVADQGPGFDVHAPRNGSGLDNMRDRLDAVGGRLSISSHPGSPTVVIGEVPVGAST